MADPMNVAASTGAIKVSGSQTPNDFRFRTAGSERSEGFHPK
jgi:hypothetical protein